MLPQYHPVGLPHIPKDDNDVGGLLRPGDTELNPMANQEMIRSKVRTEFYPFLNEQLKELVQQIEMYI